MDLNGKKKMEIENNSEQIIFTEGEGRIIIALLFSLEVAISLRPRAEKSCPLLVPFGVSLAEKSPDENAGRRRVVHFWTEVSRRFLVSSRGFEVVTHINPAEMTEE